MLCYDNLPGAKVRGDVVGKCTHCRVVSTGSTEYVFRVTEHGHTPYFVCREPACVAAELEAAAFLALGLPGRCESCNENKATIRPIRDPFDGMRGEISYECAECRKDAERASRVSELIRYGRVGLPVIEALAEDDRRAALDDWRNTPAAALDEPYEPTPADFFTSARMEPATVADTVAHRRAAADQADTETWGDMAARMAVNVRVNHKVWTTAADRLLGVTATSAGWLEDVVRYTCLVLIVGAVVLWAWLG